jgi:hypothetical protein
MSEAFGRNRSVAPVKHHRPPLEGSELIYPEGERAFEPLRYIDRQRSRVIAIVNAEPPGHGLHADYSLLNAIGGMLMN